jgi:hypothetical protein
LTAVAAFLGSGQFEALAKQIQKCDPRVFQRKHMLDTIDGESD